MSNLAKKSAKTKNQTTKTQIPQKSNSILYITGQGLAVKTPDSYKFCIVLKEITAKSKSISIKNLEQVGSSLKYKELETSKCPIKNILTEVPFKKQGKFYTLTKSQLAQVQNSIAHPEESEEDSSNWNPPVKSQPNIKPPSKRAKKPINVYKKGVFNPNVPDPIDSMIMTSPSNNPILGVSIQTNNKNFHRAVWTKNIPLFKKLLKTPKTFSSVTSYWSPDTKVTPLMIAILNEDEYFIKALIHELNTPTFKKAYEPPLTLGEISTGSVSIETFGVQVREVNMSRGGREGNNAFLHDQNFLPHNTSSLLQPENIIYLIKKGISSQTLNLLNSLIPNFENFISRYVGESVRSGHIETARHLLQEFNRRGGFGFNALHEEVLLEKDLSSFKKPSVTKKPIENFLVAPLHVACINPNTKHLKTLLSICDDPGYADASGRRCIHYAAACTSKAPIKVLLNIGAQVNDSDKQKVTPIMISAIYNRPEAAKALIKAGSNLAFKSKEAMAAIHYAADNGSFETLEVLLKHGAAPDQAGNEGRTPLAFCAAKGFSECIELLLKHGAKVIRKDRRKRTPLVHAVKNGHLKSAALLLQKGSEYNFPDSSKNSPIHYAAAYGWTECISLLIEAGADPNVANDWKLVPLLVAMMKGQTGCVRLLLEEPGIDVNCKDEEGRTLISQAIEILSNETVEQIEFLLEEKKADPNIPDERGQTALHHLCSKRKPVCWENEMSREEKESLEKKEWDLEVKALDLLVSAGADMNLRCKKGKTPIFYALESVNLKLVEFLVEAGADLTIQTEDGAGILHEVTSLDIGFMELFEKILKNKKVVKSCMHLLDSEGKSPFLKLVSFFANNIQREKERFFKETQEEMNYELKLKYPDQFNNERETRGEDSEEEEEELEELELRGGARTKETTRVPTKKTAFTKKAITVKDEKFNQYLDTSINLQIDNEELTMRVNTKIESVVNKFISLLQAMISKGADPSSTVGKLKKYRENPGLIEEEYNSLKFNPDTNHPNDQFIFSIQSFDGQQSQRPKRLEELLITDIDGFPKWNEYSKIGQQNVYHLLHNCTTPQILHFFSRFNIDINHRDFYGKTPLYKYCESNNTEMMDILLHEGADPNIFSFENKGPIHMSLANLYILEQLLNYEAIPDILSTTNELPLYNAIKNRNLKAVKLLCQKGANPNFKDKDQRTSLHYAFNFANCSADASFELESLLLYYGADINSIDKRNRTPLHYAFVKIGKHTDLSEIDPIESVSSACSRSNIDVNVQDVWQKTPLHYAAQRGALTSTMFMLSKGANLELEDQDSNTPLGLSIKNGHPNYAIMLIEKGADVKKKLKIVTSKEEQKEENEISKKMMTKAIFVQYYDNFEEERQTLEDGEYSMFRAAIIQGWQGAAYLLLYSGYDYMLAMEDAMNEDKFQLVRTLLAKVSDDSVLVELNRNRQTLLHTLAIKGAKTNEEITESICDQLYDRGVDLEALDSERRTPLHYACGSHYKHMIEFILTKDVDFESYDIHGDTPLSLAIKGEKILTSRHILEMFITKGVKMNFEYRDEDLILTPLLNAIQQKADPFLIKFLMDNGSKLSETDSLGRNALVYAIVNNDSEMLAAMLNEHQIDINQLDNKGWSVLHYAVEPLDYGSYENTEILQKLVEVGADFNIQDREGKTAYFYACEERSGRMKKVIESYKYYEDCKAKRKLSVVENLKIQDFETDSKQYIKKQRNYKTEVVLEREPDELAGGFPDYYKVIDDFDLYMIKVDISHGPYSAYLFYRMQLLRDTNRDVFVVVTRWGRITETGAFERTPFASFEEAKNEFKKIFKQKTGNEFKKQKGKYALMDKNYSRVEYKDFIKKFDFKNSPKCLLEPNIENAMKLISKVTIYKEKFSEMNVDEEVLNLSSISDEKINQAESYLEQIVELIKNLAFEKPTDYILKVKEELIELSSRFFEIIPVKYFNDIAVSPIFHENIANDYLNKLDSLKNIGIASKILLGALHNTRRINPLDYIFRSLPVEIEALHPTDLQYKLIKDYMKAGQGDSQEILAIFKINRQGEAEKTEKFNHISNRKLLWHGTETCNLLGILTRGFLVNPPGAPHSGNMFGRGIYFANVFAKSMNYTGNYFYNNLRDPASSEYFMFLCEVVLGKECTKYNAENMEKLKKQYLSVLGVGQNTPDPKQSIYLNNGVEVPIGSMIRREETTDEMIFLNYDEYIVYNPDQVRIRYLLHLNNKKRYCF